MLLSLTGCDRQEEVKHEQLMKQLAEAQVRPIDGGSVARSYKRVLK